MIQTKCRHFSGYKPCVLNSTCNESCPKKDLIEKQILIVHLEAIGAVLRSTALLPAIKIKYPHSKIIWVTKSPSHQLFKNNPLVDLVLTTTVEDLIQLRALKFDVGFVIDKDLTSIGIIQSTHVETIFGFLCDPKTGAIIPANEKAIPLWELGIDNYKKFFENNKPETQLTCEALELPYQRHEYQLFLTETEKTESTIRRKLWSQSGKKIVIGLNTGCSSKMPARKFSVKNHKSLIEKIYKKWGKQVQIVLLGGPEEHYINQSLVSDKVIGSPTNQGLRDGLISMNACDLVVSGDSLGMHMAIALKKWVVVWFGPTCHQEIDLFERGEKVLTQANCSPCWKRHCEKSTMCYDQVNLDQILISLTKGIDWTKTSSSKQLSLETLSSASPSYAV